MAYDLLIIRDHAVAVSAASLTLDNVIRAFSSALLYEETGDFDVHIRATPAPEARPQVLTVTPLSPGVPVEPSPSDDAYPRVRLRRFQNR